jgi:hypothetical protein
VPKVLEYISNVWFINISTREELDKFFCQNMNRLRYIDTLSKVLVDEDRLIIKGIAYDSRTKKQITVHIDVITDAPSTEQFVDVTHESGADSDLKIIIFDDVGLVDYEHTRQEAFTTFLVEKNNRCGVPTYLIAAENIVENRGKDLDYEIRVDPKKYKRDPSGSLPARKEVMIADFWAHYYEDALLGCGMASFVWEYGDGVLGEWSASYSLGKNTETVATWTDEGLFMSLVGRPGNEFIKWVWDNRDKYIEPHYPGCLVTLHGEPEKPHKVAVRLLELPMSELIMMSAQDKWEYGEMIYGQEQRINEVMSDALDAYYELNKALLTF